MVADGDTLDFPKILASGSAGEPVLLQAAYQALVEDDDRPQLDEDPLRGHVLDIEDLPSPHRLVLPTTLVEDSSMDIPENLLTS